MMGSVLGYSLEYLLIQPISILLYRCIQFKHLLLLLSSTFFSKTPLSSLSYCKILFRTTVIPLPSLTLYPSISGCARACERVCLCYSSSRQSDDHRSFYSRCCPCVFSLQQASLKCYHTSYTLHHQPLHCNDSFSLFLSFFSATFLVSISDWAWKRKKKGCDSTLTQPFCTILIQSLVLQETLLFSFFLLGHSHLTSTFLLVVPWRSPT